MFVPGPSTTVSSETTIAGAVTPPAPVLPVPASAVGPATTVLPAGCSPPAVPHAVFRATLVNADFAINHTARFKVLELVSGSLAGFEIGGLADVDFGPDVGYLRLGDTYLVAAAVDDASGRLVSKAKAELPRFGGDQVVGVDDRDVVCPTFDDPVISKMSDGSSIETGVFAPMIAAKSKILSAFLRPAGAAFGALVALVAIKRSLAVLVRRLRRHRRHRRATAGLASRRLRLPTAPARPR